MHLCRKQSHGYKNSTEKEQIYFTQEVAVHVKREVGIRYDSSVSARGGND